jgi:hypothetical protein
MAIAVIAGLTFATFLTLLLVPVMYSVLDDFDNFISKNFKPSRVEAELEAERELEVTLTGEHRLPEPSSI